MLGHTKTLLWRIGALAALALGILGAVLPIVPTVPFILVAAWAASKGWPTLEQRLLEHRLYGSYIRNWRQRGAVPRSAKLLATLMMLGSAVGLQLTPAPQWLRIAVPLTMLAVAAWLWMRPET